MEGIGFIIVGGQCDCWDKERVQTQVNDRLAEHGTLVQTVSLVILSQANPINEDKEDTVQSHNNHGNQSVFDQMATLRVSCPMEIKGMGRINLLQIKEDDSRSSHEA